MKLSTATVALFVAHSASAFVTQKPAFSSSTALNKFKVFIDGEAGTTGLQVRGRIEARDDLEIISPPDALRKDAATRRKLINEADAVILCKFQNLLIFLWWKSLWSIEPNGVGETVSIKKKSQCRICFGVRRRRWRTISWWCAFSLFVSCNTEFFRFLASILGSPRSF